VEHSRFQDVFLTYGSYYDQTLPIVSTVDQGFWPWRKKCKSYIWSDRGTD